MSKTREEEKTGKFAKSLDLDSMINSLKAGEKTGPNMEAAFKKNNAKVDVAARVGGNNAVLILKNDPVVILTSELRQPAVEAIKKLSANGSPAWLAKEYRVITTKTNPENNKRYEDQDKSFSGIQKTCPPGLNNFDYGRFASVSVVEKFSGSLEQRVRNAKDDEERINLACQLGVQVSAMLAQLGNEGCLWTDVKPGNILIRADDSIGLSDIKALMPHEQVLVKEVSGYQNVLVKNEADFQEKLGSLQDNQLLIKAPDETGNIQYGVKKQNGEVVSDIIPKEKLEEVFKKGYGEFNRKLTANNPKLIEVDALKLINVAAQKGHTQRAYSAHFTDVTDTFISKNFNEKEFNKKYDSPEAARTGALESWKKEYPHQFAILLYHIAANPSPEEGVANFDFSKPVFQSQDGKRLQNIITRASHEDPANRMPLENATRILDRIANDRNLKNANVSPTAEPEQKEKKSKFSRSISRRFSKKDVSSEIDKRRQEQQRIEAIQPKKPGGDKTLEKKDEPRKDKDMQTRFKL